MKLHPSFVRLNAFADGDLKPRRHERVASHLSNCARCRTEVAEIRWLRSTARVLHGFPLQRDLKPAILARLRERQPALAPAAAPARRWVSSRQWSAAAAAGLVAMLFGGSMLSPDRLASEASSVEFFPAKPNPGQTIEVRVTVTSQFAGLDKIVLRGEERAPSNVAWENRVHLSVDTLRRVEQNLFVGTKNLTGDFAYGVYAIEDASGERIDTNRGHYWELLVHDDGRPSVDALLKQVQDLRLRDWTRAIEVARLATALYPGTARTWQQRITVESDLFVGATADSLKRVYSGVYRELAKKLRASNAPPAELAAMHWAGLRLGKAGAAQEWRDVLLARHPGHPDAVAIRTLEIQQANDGTSAEALEQLESIWNDRARNRVGAVQTGAVLAVQALEDAAIDRWYERLSAVVGPFAVANQAYLVNNPRFRERAANGLAAALTTNTDRLFTRRPLDRSKGQHASQMSRRVGQARAKLGQLLLAAGDTMAAIDQIGRAVDPVWDASLYRQYAHALFGVKDTAQAVSWLARANADPSWPDEIKFEMEQRGVGVVGRSEWVSRVDAARDVMIRRLLENGPRGEGLSSGFRLLNAKGDTIWRDDLLRAPVTVVVLFEPSPRGVRTINRASAIIEPLGARMVVVARPSEFDRARTELTGSLELLSDTDGSAHRALQTPPTLRLFVVSRNGQVWFEHGIDLANLGAEVYALDSRSKATLIAGAW